MQPFAVSGVKKTDFSGLAIDIATEFLPFNPSGEKAAHDDSVEIEERARIALGRTCILLILIIFLTSKL
jgi:hypothetical protein